MKNNSNNSNYSDKYPALFAALTTNKKEEPQSELTFKKDDQNQICITKQQIINFAVDKKYKQY